MRGRSEITPTYVGGTGRHGSPPLSDKLVGVKTNLNDVVEQSQEWSQRERCDKDGGEAKLEHCRGKNRSDEPQRTSGSILAHITLDEYNTRMLRFTHFEVFIHQAMGVHWLQIPVFVPLWKLGFILYILPCTTSFLHLSTRPPVLQQTENVASSLLSTQSNYFGQCAEHCRDCLTKPPHKRIWLYLFIYLAGK